MTVMLITGNVRSVGGVGRGVVGGGHWSGLRVPIGVLSRGGDCGASARPAAIGAAQRVRSYSFVGINAFIVTLGTLTAIRGLVLILTDGRSLIVSTPAAKAQMVAFEGGRIPAQTGLFVLGGVLVLAFAFRLIRLRSRGAPVSPGAIGGIVGGGVLIVLAALAGPTLTLAKPVIYTAIYTLIVWSVLTFTTTGRRVYATGGNAVAARLAGVNVGAYKMAGFILSSATAGFAGILFGSRLGAVNPTALQGAELTVIAAAILGGTSLFGGAGSVIKTLVGALLLFTLTNGFNILNLGANYQGVIEGTVVVAAAAIYTVGGKRGRKARS